MGDVTIRELRNHGGDVVDRASGGEPITITRAGKPVAELHPVSGPSLQAEALLARWRRHSRRRPRGAARGPRRRAGRSSVNGPRHARGVLDTSTVILLPRIADAAALPAEPLITTVTLAELSVSPLVAREEGERAARQAHLQQAEADFTPLPFDAAARAFGRVAASLRQSGRTSAARTYDAMIAATALAHDLPVYTANPGDFRGVDGLEVVAVDVAPIR
jgi:prevent-host-death family protein